MTKSLIFLGKLVDILLIFFHDFDKIEDVFFFTIGNHLCVVFHFYLLLPISKFTDFKVTDTV